MIRSTPSSRARRAASPLRMPQSTDTMTPHAVGVQPLDRRRLQAVAVAQPLGDEVHDVAAEQLERAAQDDRGGHAVDVVVAVDRDALAAARARAHRRSTALAQVGQQRRDRAGDRAAGRGSGAACVRIAEPAEAQQPGDDRRHARARRASALRAVIVAQATGSQRSVRIVLPITWRRARRRRSSAPRRPMSAELLVATLEALVRRAGRAPRRARRQRLVEQRARPRRDPGARRRAARGRCRR